MLDAFLVPANTVVTGKGDSQAIDITTAANRAFLVTLSVSAIVEQEAIDVSIFTSVDGVTWDVKPVGVLSQKFYAGEYPLLVDLSAVPDAKFIRAHWDVNRWGRGSTAPRFEIGLRLREVSPEDLKESAAEASTHG